MSRPQVSKCGLFVNFNFSYMKKIVTAHNYERKGYSSNMPSLTVPGQVLSLRSIRDRFQRGQSVETFSSKAVYNESFPPGYESMDKIERIEAVRANASRISAMRNELSAKAKREAEKAELLKLSEDLSKSEE